MIAFTWFPHVDLKCSANISLPCEESGMGTEIISDMANLLNLTIDVYKEKDENWGFIPHGYYNISWSGVMGLVYKVKEVILHPEWTLILRKEGENVILRDMINRIPEPAIIQYSNDVNAQPEKYLMPNIEEGLLKIRTGKFVFLIDYPPIGRLLKISADNKKKFSGFTVAHPRTVHYNFLLEKKSPLTYIFTPVALYVKEMGLVHAQKMRALGSLYFEAPESSTNPLDVRQLKSIFYFLFLSCFCSLTYCVFGEILDQEEGYEYKKGIRGTSAVTV
ncbi:unnamed protein product [Lepeophtheirus salmonis]|uniref:(salmon louse) hypothetical protein n=1 Tax=Lepeophtheirus salmonis TaxID=72036 RepID=A0A7R8H7B7_LEPSM|nr:unnamed protein product [Lepeophtheirus salmonis]CAF2915299.1 unnamed protein product [Lepeophtheirus salmonis]